MELKYCESDVYFLNRRKNVKVATYNFGSVYLPSLIHWWLFKRSRRVLNNIILGVYFMNIGYCNQTTYILKVIRNATGTSVIFPINISLIHFVFVLTSVPNVGERFTKA